MYDFKTKISFSHIFVTLQNWTDVEIHFRSYYRIAGVLTVVCNWARRGSARHSCNGTMNINCGYEVEPQMLTIINKAAGNVSKKQL